MGSFREKKRCAGGSPAHQLSGSTNEDHAGHVALSSVKVFLADVNPCTDLHRDRLGRRSNLDRLFYKMVFRYVVILVYGL